MSDLRAGSFVDDGIQYGRRKGHVSLDCVETGEDDVWSTAEAIYWRNVAHAVAALPKTYAGRAFLHVWADRGDVLNAARDVGVSHWYARKTVERFLRRMGMKCV